MADLKFSDIGKSDKKTAPSVGEIVDADINGARLTHAREMDKIKKELRDKIANLEKKVASHTLKEGMVDKIINQTNYELENLGEKEFTKRGQKQTVLIKQLEALSIIQDTILKFEDMIQKYHKILIDLENNKLNSFLKVEGLRKEEEKADDNIGEVLMALQQQLQSGGDSNNYNPLMDDIKRELSENNY